MEIGYKLFEQDTRDGKLYPLFIGKKTETKIGEWIHAEFIPTKGFAIRSGWHIGANLPSAPHLISADGNYKSKRGKNFRRVWCEVEYNNQNNYTELADKQPKHCFVEMPQNGFYRFKEPSGALWIITSDIKIIKVLTEEERQVILKRKGFDEKKACQKRVEILQNASKRH
jgi:hypothetical protein